MAKKLAGSFPNLKKDAILVIPAYHTKKYGINNDSKNISSFVKDAPVELQQAL